MKSNTVVITQPNYLPWMGYFEQIKKSDTFVFLDTVQFERREWQNRNKIKCLTGEWMWLTVPTLTKGHYHAAIKDIEINYSDDWISQQLNAIKHNYSKTKYFNETFEFLSGVLNQRFTRLMDLNICLIKEIAQKLNLNRKFILASELNAAGSKTDLLIDICKKTGATTYYSSNGARAYMDPEEFKFRDNNIVLEYQNYEHPIYPQFGSAFLSFMSVIDLLFNRGPESAKCIDSAISSESSSIQCA